jgi:hypothetical protein
MGEASLIGYYEIGVVLGQRLGDGDVRDHASTLPSGRLRTQPATARRRACCWVEAR